MQRVQFVIQVNLWNFCNSTFPCTPHNGIAEMEFHRIVAGDEKEMNENGILILFRTSDFYFIFFMEIYVSCFMTA